MWLVALEETHFSNPSQPHVPDQATASHESQKHPPTLSYIHLYNNDYMYPEPNFSKENMIAIESNTPDACQQ